MTDVRKATQLVVTSQDRAGMLADVSGVFSQAGINMTAICAYGMEGKAVFYIICDSNEKAKAALAAKGWEIKEEEVLIIRITNESGVLNAIAEKFKQNNINLLYCYGSTCESKCLCQMVVKGQDNEAVIQALK